MVRYDTTVTSSIKEGEPSENPVAELLKAFFSRFDLLQILPALALLAIGGLFIYGVGQQVGGIYASIWKQQLLYMGFGGVLWFCLIFIDYRWLAPLSILFYPAAIGLLMLVLYRGTTLYGAQRWLSIAGYSVQPSEFGKLAVILAVSSLLACKKADVNKPFWILGVLILAGIPFYLIYLEPDLGTACVILPITAAMVFVSNLKLKWVCLLLVLAVIAVPIAYMNLKAYQKERVETFLNPKKSSRDSGWNAEQAELAVGSGGLLGKGFMKGERCRLGYLPTTVANSDFIFPVIAEETGFVGSMVLFLLYAVLLFSIFRTAYLAPDPFGRCLCTAIAVLLTVHIAVNVGMCIRLFPITGLPLPLVSYGGSFLVAIMIYLGIVQSVYAHRNRVTFMAI